MSAEFTIRKVLDESGIEVNGTNSCDIQIHDARFYSRLMSEGSLGLGESYMDEWWEVKDLAPGWRPLKRFEAITVDIMPSRIKHWDKTSN